MRNAIQALRTSLGTLAWHVSGVFGGADLALRYRPGRRLLVRGKVAKSKLPAISDFMRDDIGVEIPVTIRGSRASGLWRWRFSSSLSARQSQRARNFLNEHLR